ncbi:MAG TPA: lipoyl(octanoyl) transferase LipB [Gemmatimonadales bacterium]|jgi:lipoate-protein ligase B
MTTRVEIVDLGRQRYADTLELQRTLRQRRLDGSLPHDVLLLVEHEPVYTLGRGTHASSLPRPVDELRAMGADVVEIERGGDVTWHGPGQLVGYPIVHLSAHREDLHWYLRTLEATLIGALATLDVGGERSAGQTGVWVQGRKIASIGIHVRQWVTLHGFALNVDPDLRWFDAIVPCGIQGVAMTSVASERPSSGRIPQLWDATIAAVTAAFGRQFSRAPHAATLDALLSPNETSLLQAEIAGLRNGLAHLP